MMKNPENIKLMIVEDNEINAELLLIQLNDLGYSADKAENGQVFLQMMSENQYDLVLMDCHMPVLNGFEATEQYRSTEHPGKHIPIIAVTASTIENDKKKCFTSGMDDYISKPVNLATLHNVLIHWLAPSNTT